MFAAATPRKNRSPSLASIGSNVSKQSSRSHYHASAGVNAPVKRGGFEVQNMSTKKPLGDHHSDDDARSSASSTAISSRHHRRHQRAATTSRHGCGSSAVAVREQHTSHHQHQMKKGKRDVVALLSEDTKAKSTVPLLVVLFAECASIIGVFVILIVVTSVSMSSTTKDLVEQRIISDLKYSHLSVKNPIDFSEKLLRDSHLKFHDQTLGNNGAQPCSALSNAFEDSRSFFRDGLSTIETYGRLVGYIYTATRNPLNITHPITGEREVTECGMCEEYIYTRNSSAYRSSVGPVSLNQARNNFQDVESFENPTHPYDTYVYNGMSFTDFTWHPFFWIESNGVADLLLGGYAPLIVNRTLANGTVESYFPDLSVPKLIKSDPLLTTVSFFAVDLRLSHINGLIKGVTPPTEGAHTSMYDLRNGGAMLATSSTAIQIYGENREMWPAGMTGDPAINDAFAILAPQPVTDPEALIKIDTTTTLQYTNDRIISSIRIAGYSGIDFIIIQSTPIAYYMAPVTQLQTVMITLGVAAALLVTAVCVAIVLAIRTTISQLQHGMVLAAILKNERVLPCRSIMTELDNLCVAFAQMNAKLGAAKAFMPQSMLLSSDSDPDVVDGGEDGVTVTEGDAMTRSSAGNGRRRSGRQNKSHADDDDTASVLPYTSDYQTGKERHGKLGGGGNHWQSEAGLAVKRVTILAVNARGFHRTTATGGAESSIASLTAELTSIVQTATSASRGIIDSFHGDHFVISFNAAKTNAQGPAMAVQCALEIRDNFNTILTAKASSSSSPSAAGSNGPLGGGATSMGIATGRAAVGHLGNNDLKRFSIIGKVYGRAQSLERICKKIAEEGATLLMMAMAEATSTDEKRKSNANALFLNAIVRMNQKNSNQRRGESDSDDANDENLFEYDPSTSLLAQILTDGSVAPDIEHSYYLQVMGKMSEASLLQAHTAANNTLLQQYEQQQRLAANMFGGSGNDVKEKDRHPNSSVPPYVVAGGTSLVAPLPKDGETIIYAVRGSSSTHHGGNKNNNNTNKTHDVVGGDEWLYEIKQEGSVNSPHDPILPIVNKMMLNFLSRVGPRAIHSTLVQQGKQALEVQQQPPQSPSTVGPATAPPLTPALIASLLFPHDAMECLGNDVERAEKALIDCYGGNQQATTACANDQSADIVTHFQVADDNADDHFMAGTAAATPTTTALSPTMFHNYFDESSKQRKLGCEWGQMALLRARAMMMANTEEGAGGGQNIVKSMYEA